jgi:hypothetical protein
MQEAGWMGTWSSIYHEKGGCFPASDERLNLSVHLLLIMMVDESVRSPGSSSSRPTPALQE